MAETLSTKGRPFVVGVNHRSSSMAMRDRVFVDEADIPAFLEKLKGKGLDQALLLSTCDRIEVQAVADDLDKVADTVVATLAQHGEVDADELRGQTYQKVDEDAVRHVFAVTASLDSLVIGEPQILGQVKAGHKMAKDAGLMGPVLDAILQAAFSVAKKVRHKTSIGERPVSIAAAATEIAQSVHGDLSRVRALMIGVGEMGELIAEDLMENGLQDLVITHPVEVRAKPVARHLDCHFDPFDRLPELLVESDIVLACLGKRSHTLTHDMVQTAIKARKRRPIFLVDAAIPGDIDNAVNKISDAYLYDLGELEEVALEGLAKRESQADIAWDIIDRDLGDFLKGRAERWAVPALKRLRDHFEEVREQALKDAGGDAEKATRLLVNRLLHGPSEAVRGIAAERGDAPEDQIDWNETERVLNRLFGFKNDGESR